MEGQHHKKLKNMNTGIGNFVSQFGSSGSGGGGGGGLSSVDIQNTLYVAKNGNDGTGTPNDLSKPYLTIASASADASVGDCIYVYRGSYTETTADTFVSNVYYYLEPNVDVTNDTHTLIGDTEEQSKNIYIFGYGNLICLLQAVILLNNPSSNLRLQCNNMASAFQIMVFAGQKCEVDCQDINFQGSGINYSGSGNSYINFNTCTSTNTAQQTWYIQHQQGTLTIRGRTLTQDYARSGGLPFDVNMLGEEEEKGKLILEIDQFIAISGGTAIKFQATGMGVLVKNMLKKGGSAITLVGTCNVSWFNCQFKTTANLFELSGSATNNLTNCLMYQTSSLMATLTGTSVLNCVDCVFQMNAQSVCIRLTQTGTDEPINPVLILQNVSFYQIAGGTYAFCVRGVLNGSLPPSQIPIYVQGNVTATQDIDTSNLVNAISGNAIVVDTDVQVSTNFLKIF
jgi:hypothetical protein